MDKSNEFSFKVKYLVFSDHVIQPFDFRLLQNGICLKSRKDVYYLGKTSMESFKFSKNVHLAKFKLLFVWILFKPLFHLVKAVLVFLTMKHQNRRKGNHQRRWLCSPKVRVAAMSEWNGKPFHFPALEFPHPAAWSITFPSSNLANSWLLVMQLRDAGFALRSHLVGNSLTLCLPPHSPIRSLRKTISP